jgi:hypothetical protein
MMDVDEPVVPEPTELPVEPEEEEEEEEYEEMITLKASDFVTFQDILEDMRSQITDLQRNACQDRLETQDMLLAILDRQF